MKKSTRRLLTDLQDRIDKLENANDIRVYVPGPPKYWYGSGYYKQVSISSVLLTLIDNLGLELQYQPSQNAKVMMSKKKSEKGE